MKKKELGRPSLSFALSSSLSFHPFLLYLTTITMTWIEYLLNRPLAEPTSVAPWADAYQRIHMIKLRLQPPEKICSCSDLFYIVVNHDFLRLLIAVLWLVVCGYIESFLAQLSEMRYSNTVYDRVSFRGVIHISHLYESFLFIYMHSIASTDRFIARCFSTYRKLRDCQLPLDLVTALHYTHISLSITRLDDAIRSSEALANSYGHYLRLPRYLPGRHYSAIPHV